MERLHEKRELEPPGNRREILEPSDDSKPRSWNSVEGESLLRLRLVEAERERERIAAGVGNPEKLADRRNVGFTIYSVKPLGDVEDDVWFCGAKTLGKFFVCLEANHFSKAG